MASGGFVSDDDFDERLFGEPHPGTIRTLRERVERHAPRAREMFGEFFDDMRDVFERHNGRAALRRIRSNMTRMKDSLRRDTYRFMKTVEEMQEAKPRMQRALMAHPRMRRMELDQVIEAFVETDYLNPNWGEIGWHDSDFRRITDGVLLTDDTLGDHDTWIALQDLERDDYDERPLDIVEQKAVLDTWDFLDAALTKRGLDPSSTTGGRL